MKSPHYLLLLTALCLLLYLPGIASIPLIDRDEPHFAQATRQMVQTDNYFQINFQAQPRHLKPPGIYWLQAVFVKFFKYADATAPWPYRLPSVLGAMMAVLLTFIFTRKFYEDKSAFLAAVLLACSSLLLVEAHLCVTDAALLATMVLMQGSLGVTYLQSKEGTQKNVWLWPLLFWFGMALGVFIKGITPIVAVLTIVTLCLIDKDRRWLKALHWQWGLLLLVLFTLAWLIPFSLIGKSNFLFDMIHKDLLPKLAAGGQQSHGKPPGYFVLIFTLMFWPGSLFFWQAFYYAWQHYHLPREKFLLAWSVPVWLLFEVIPTKLPEYILPAYPAIAILTALAITKKVVQHMPPTLQIINKTYYLIWWLYALGASIAIIYFSYALSNQVNYESFVIAIIFLLMNSLSIYYVWQKKLLTAVKILVPTAILCLVLFYQGILPNLNGLWISKNVATIISKNHLAISDQQPLQSVGYAEPSLVFMLGTNQVEFTDIMTALNKMAQEQSRLLLIDSQLEQETLQLAKRKNLNLLKRFEVKGFNINGGRQTTLFLYQLTSNNR